MDIDVVDQEGEERRRAAMELYESQRQSAMREYELRYANWARLVDAFESETGLPLRSNVAAFNKWLAERNEPPYDGAYDVTYAQGTSLE